MSKYRFKTLPRRQIERANPKITVKPAKITKKSKPKVKKEEEDDIQLLFHWKNCEYDVIK